MALPGKHRIIGAGLRAVAATRADRWLAPAARGLGSILMFHRVRPPEPDQFQPSAPLEVTPEHLELTLRTVRDLGLAIVPLDDVPDRLRRGEGNFVVLTFDDGYRDNFDFASPILRRHRAPWTMFVTTEYASGRGRLWWLELEEVVRRSEAIRFGSRELPARTLPEKVAACEAIYRELRAGPEERLRDTIARWCEAAGIDTDALVRRHCLGWDDLAALGRDDPGVSFGAHTLSHPMLAKHDAERSRREIVEARDEIAGRLGRPVRHIAYPVGDPGSAGPREFALAREAGYATGVTTRPGPVFGEHAAHLTALPRVSINGFYQSAGAVRALLSGVPFLAWNRGRRVSVG